MTTKTKNAAVSMPEGYDSRDYPTFAVTVDVLVFTLVDDVLHVLLVRRGNEPYAGRWAIPGGFKHPTETLDDAARRELTEETGIEAPSVLSQLGAYGDPGRDPRTNVVTVAYVAVVRDVGDITAGTDAAHAALVPVAKVLRRSIELAFDHDRIVRDALDRIRRDLEATGIAAAFVGPTFTLAELRTVYEAVWDVNLDGANFRRSITADAGWVVPTGKRAAPGPTGGKPPELYKAGKAWKRGGPIRRPRRTSGKGVTR